MVRKKKKKHKRVPRCVLFRVLCVQLCVRNPRAFRRISRSAAAACRVRRREEREKKKGEIILFSRYRENVGVS